MRGSDSAGDRVRVRFCRRRRCEPVAVDRGHGAGSGTSDALLDMAARMPFEGDVVRHSRRSVVVVIHHRWNGPELKRHPLYFSFCVCFARFAIARSGIRHDQRACTPDAALRAIPAGQTRPFSGLTRQTACTPPRPRCESPSLRRGVFCARRRAPECTQAAEEARRAPWRLLGHTPTCLASPRLAPTRTFMADAMPHFATSCTTPGSACACTHAHNKPTVPQTPARPEPSPANAPVVLSGAAPPIPEPARGPSRETSCTRQLE